MSLECGGAKLTAFVHADNKRVGMITADTADIRFRLVNPKFGRKVWGFLRRFSIRGYKNRLKDLYYKKPSKGTEHSGGITLKYFIQKIDGGRAFGVFIAVKKSPSSWTAAFTVGSSLDGEDWIENSRKIISDTLQNGYENEISGHISWWETFWNKSSVILADKILEKNWYLTNYFLGSASR